MQYKPVSEHSRTEATRPQPFEAHLNNTSRRISDTPEDIEKYGNVRRNRRI